MQNVKYNGLAFEIDGLMVEEAKQDKEEDNDAEEEYDEG